VYRLRWYRRAFLC